ncbi:flavin-containing monooxygenase [Nocardia abscessus]|uniref:flavin-containing monooxygenase n=1 Tax=Nocardia abscessus TaxID=120957 RepID=UPI00245736AE|nr:NAD(P)/FAD-dependent oxidoreductase [Nocardia abscessus]
MRVAVIGAGVAGLTTAKVLGQAGHDVEVFDTAPDVGGVWSRARRYPGLTTQSPAAQYSFSDFPMPRDYPEWPTGEQIQQYLAAYAQHFGIEPELETEVVSVVPDGDRWLVGTRHGDEEHTEAYDRVVVANGVFCQPRIPSYPGLDEFVSAGGALISGNEFHDVEDASNKRVLVVGYGKSACDVTVPASDVALSTDVIARQLLWKIPRKIAGTVNFKALLLTRLGEALFRYRYLRGMERFLHGPANRLRSSMLNSLGPVSIRQLGLDDLGLVPAGRMEDIVKGAIGLATEGFFEGVAAGTITVHRDQTITRLLADSGKPAAQLADGVVLPADLVICATGFEQGVPFLAEHVQEPLFDERGNFMLYRQIQPIDVPGLYFNGYNSSFFSPLNAEMAAVWIAADLAGALTLPDRDARRADVVAQLAFMDEAVDGHHCRGTKIIPFSLKNVDEVLDDVGIRIGRLRRAGQWLAPVDPAAYRKVTPRLLARLARDRPDVRTAGPVTTADRGDADEQGTRPTATSTGAA